MGREQGIRAIVIASHALQRRGLVWALESDEGVAVVGDAETAEEGSRLAAELRPEVAVIATPLPDAPGMACVTLLRGKHPAIRTIVLTRIETDDGLFAAIRAGAAAYHDVDIEGDDLCDLVARCAAGDVPIRAKVLSRPDVADRVLEEFRSALARRTASQADYPC